MFSSFPAAHFARHSVPPQVIGGSNDTDDGFGDANLLLQVPGAVLPGDMLIAFVGGHDSDGIVPPGGWTTIFYDPFFFRVGEDRSAGVYYRVAALGDAGGIYNWTVNNASGGFGDAETAGSMVAVRGVSAKQPVLVSNRTASASTAHSITVPTPSDQYAIFITGWHGMDSGGSAPGTSSGSLTLVSGTENYISSGGWTSMSAYYLQIPHPSDSVVGSSVGITYLNSVDADTYGVMLEGEFA